MFDKLLKQQQLPARGTGAGLLHQMFAKADIGRGKGIEIGAFAKVGAAYVDAVHSQHPVCASAATLAGFKFRM